MKIFFVWSGELSYRIAELLSKWLPSMIQTVIPIISADEDKKGAAWFQKLMDQLIQTDFVIVCLSRDNLNSPWLFFETGVIAKSFDQAHVRKILIGDLSDKDIEKPLLNLQSTELRDKEDMRRLIQTINQTHVTRMLSSNALNRVFDRGWPKLEDYCNKAIEEMLGREEIKKLKSNHQLLEEINGLCLHLVETMDAVAKNIEHINNHILSQNVVSFPQKGVRKA